MFFRGSVGRLGPGNLGRVGPGILKSCKARGICLAFDMNWSIHGAFNDIVKGLKMFAFCCVWAFPTPRPAWFVFF